MAGRALRPLEPGRGISAKACLLYDCFGLPCPACGSSRAGLSLLAAFIYNPLVTLALCIGICILAIRFTSGRQLVMNWSRRIDRLVPLCLVAVVLVNWIYVLSRH